MARNIMPRNKPLLLLALYARPKHPDGHHYALMITEKPDKQPSAFSATKFHALNTLHSSSVEASQPWRCETTSIADVSAERRLLACIVIAKVQDEASAVQILGSIPVYQHDDPDQEKAAAFDCAAWVREAVARLRSSSAVASMMAFEEIEQSALRYVAKKTHEGCWTHAARPGVPMLDLLQGRELAP